MTPNRTRTAAWFRSIAALATILFVSPQAVASDFTVRVIDDRGRPVSDAVVTLKPESGSYPPLRLNSAVQVAQQDTQFHPFVTVVPVGTTVSFPNFDPFRHHVYSFSPAKRFELKLFARDQNRSVTFDRAGIVAVGCNIHDSMSAYIFVTDTTWTARTSPAGIAVIQNVPVAAMRMQLWHPYLHTPGGTLTRPITAADAGREQVFKIQLRPRTMHAMGGY